MSTQGGPMKMIMSSMAMVTMLSVAASAQSGDKMDQMAKDQTYTGCVAAGTMAGTFTLTHITADHMGKDAMKKDTMAKGPMAKEASAFIVKSLKMVAASCS